MILTRAEKLPAAELSVSARDSRPIMIDYLLRLDNVYLLRKTLNSKKGIFVHLLFYR
jgi:hypothetical protein